MTAPNVPPAIPANFVPTNNESIDLKTGIVTEAVTGIQMSEDQYAQAMVNAHEAHDVNEARVKMGLPQITTLPASPDGAGNPTFTVAPASGYTQTAGQEQALVSVPNVAIPAAPAPSAPPVHHANWLHSILVALEAAGALVSSPAVVAMLPPKYQGYAVAIGAVDGFVAGSSQSSPSTGN